MTPWATLGAGPKADLYHGDCRAVLAALPEKSVQVCVTSPPYFGLRDYGVAGQIGLEPTPEDFVAALVEREVVGHRDTAKGNGGTGADFLTANSRAATVPVTAPATEAAKEWAGYGTALKPAWEPIIAAMRPLDGTFAGNAVAHGCAGLNVDGCRIGTEGATRKGATHKGATVNAYGNGLNGGSGEPIPGGRWPANVVLDPLAAALLDLQSGEVGGGQNQPFVFKRASGADRDGNRGPAYGAESRPAGSISVAYTDTGGASRFFYTAKAAASEREAGLEEMAKGILAYGNQAQAEAARGNLDHGAGNESGMNRVKARANTHPTVKPLDLMQWLCRLTRPPKGGAVLDPFMGSGTTGAAALCEGRDFYGVELDGHNFEIAVARIQHWADRAPYQQAKLF